MSTATATATTAPTPPHVVEDCRGVLQVYSDGSIRRFDKPSFDVPVYDDGSVLWKDVVFDTTHNLYKPATFSAPTSGSGSAYSVSSSKPNELKRNKLPIFYYFHGGGFCIGSRTWPHCQRYCFRLSSELQAIIVSPDYRLAPENRLPAAINDGLAALEWLRAQAVSDEPDEWLAAQEADFSRVFISGDSAGGNIAHHLATRVGSGSVKMDPVRIRGYVLLAPFFGGVVRTKSEAEGPKDAFLNLELIDRFWRLSLPIGATTDHPLVNPFGPLSPNLEEIEFDPILVVMGENDLLKDRAKDYATRLRDMGKKIQYVEFVGQQHGFFTLNPDSVAANELMIIIKKFGTENLD